MILVVPTPVSGVRLYLFYTNLRCEVMIYCIWQIGYLDLCLRLMLSLVVFLLQDFFDLWTNAGTHVSDFVKRSVLESAKPARVGGREGYRSCDGYCMALVIDRSVVLSAEPVYCTVELSGQFTRGQMVVDWDGLLQQPCNTLVVKELDIEKIKLLFMLMVKPVGTLQLVSHVTGASKTYENDNNNNR